MKKNHVFVIFLLTCSFFATLPTFSKIYAANSLEFSLDDQKTNSATESLDEVTLERDDTTSESSDDEFTLSEDDAADDDVSLDDDEAEEEEISLFGDEESDAAFLDEDFGMEEQELGVDEEALEAELMGADEDLALEESEMVVETEVEVPLPIIGIVDFKGTMNLETGEYVLSKEINLGQVGPVKFDPLLIQISSMHGLKGRTTASIGERKLDVFLDFIRGDEDGEIGAQFRLKFRDELQVALTPWKVLNIQEWYLAITSEKQEMYTLFSFEKKNDAKLSMGSEYGGFFEFKAEMIRPSTLFPFFKGTEMDKAEFKDLLLRVQNPLSPKTEGALELKMNLDASNVNLGLNVDMSKLKSVGEITSDDGFILKATLPDVSLPPVGKITDTALIFSNRDPDKLPKKYMGEVKSTKKMKIPKAFQMKDSSDLKKGLKKRAYIRLLGSATLTIPTIGKIETSVRADFQRKRFVISGAINKKVEAHGMKLTNPYFYASTDGLLEVVGAAKLIDLEIYAHLQATVKDGKPILIFYGTLKDKKTIKPLEKSKLKIPGLTGFSLGDVVLGFSSDGSLYFDGTTTIFGLTSRARVKYKKKSISFWFETPKDFTLSSFIPGTDINIIKGLKFNKMWIVGSSQDYYDEEHEVEVHKGISVVSDVEMEGALFAPLKSFFKIGKGTLKFAATKGKTPKDVYISLQIPMKVKLSSMAQLQGISIEIGLVPPAIGGIASLHVTPTKDELLKFDAMIKALPAKILVSGTMQGKWKDPLKIKGLTIEDVAAEVGLLMPNIPIFGLTGMLDVGSKKMKMAVKFSPDFSDVILMGHLNRLGVSDIVGLANKVGAKIPSDLVIPYDLRDVDFIFAPSGGSIGKITFDAGMTAKGECRLLNVWGKVKYTIGMDGVTGIGVMNKIDLPGITITGKGLDGKYGTADDGPVVNTSFNMREQKIMLSGTVELFGLKREADIHIGFDGIRFKLTQKLLDAFTMELNAFSGKTDGAPNFEVTGTVENKFIDYVQGKVNEAAGELQKQVKKGFGAAQKKVDSIQGKIDDLENEIKAKVNRIDYLKDVIRAKNEAVKGNVRAARQKIESARGRVKGIDDQIRRKRDRINYLRRVIGKNELMPLPVDIPPHLAPEHLTFAKKQSIPSPLEFASQKVEKEILSTSIKEHEDILKQAEPESVKYAGFFDDVGDAFNAVGGAVAEGASRVADGVTQVYKGGRWLIQEGARRVADGVKMAWDGVKWVTEQAYRAAKTAAQKAWRGMRYGPEIAKLAAEIAALHAAKASAQATLHSIEAALRGTEAAAFDPTSAVEAAEITAIGFEITALQAAKAPLYAALGTAKAALKAAELSAQGVLFVGANLAKFLLTALGKLIEIKKITMHASAQEVKNGEMPTMALTVSVLGAEKTIRVKFNVKDAAKSTQDVVNALVGLLKP